MAAIRRYAWTVFVFFAVLATMFGVFPGGWFESDVDRDSTLLTSTYGVVAVVLTVAIAVTAFRRFEMWAWLAFWVWPLFFVVHGIAFFPVDFAFALVGVLALLATYPSRSRSGWSRGSAGPSPE